MKTIGDCLQCAVRLAPVSDTPRLDVECLLMHVLQKPRSFLYTWPERELSARAEAEFNHLLQRRLTGEPVAYLVGFKEFWGLVLAVAPSTLIPRPETELLVEATLERLTNDRARVLDLGTGTGAIALALAAEKPEWELTAVDSDEQAVALAEQNRERLRLTNVRVEQSDWFSVLSAGQFDAIVSNPPYVAQGDAHLQTGDVRFEPRRALVAGSDGLASIREIVAGAPAFLAPGGWLLVEHGYNQGGAVRALFESKNLSGVTTMRDLAGQERITAGKM